MKTLQEMIKDFTNVTVEQEKIDRYLETQKLDLTNADLSNIKITKKQLEELKNKQNKSEEKE